jgi:hypothetical protein
MLFQIELLLLPRSEINCYVYHSHPTTIEERWLTVLTSGLSYLYVTN